MPALRILQVVPYYEDAWAYGGIPRVAATLAHGLARRGHQVTICTTDACDADQRLARPAHTPPANIDVRVFPNVSNTLAYHRQLFLPVGLRRWLRRAAGSFDIAHLHACRNLPVAFAAHAFRRAGIPYVLEPNGTAPLIERRTAAKRVFDATVGRGVTEGAARVIAVSGAERDQFITLGISSSRVALVPNPVDEREFEPAPDSRQFRERHGLGDEPIVLLLAKLTPRKGAGVLLRAFGAMKTASTLVIAGNDMGSGVAIPSSIGGRPVRRIGLLRGRDRLEALAAADAVVYPSSDEVFGLVPLEALLAGTPVVVCSDSGAGEVIGTVGGGHIVPHGDAEALAGAIDSLITGASLWRQRARLASARVRKLFGADTVCERLEGVYEDVLGRAAERPRRLA